MQVTPELLLAMGFQKCTGFTEETYTHDGFVYVQFATPRENQVGENDTTGYFYGPTLTLKQLIDFLLELKWNRATEVYHD